MLDANFMIGKKFVDKFVIQVETQFAAKVTVSFFLFLDIRGDLLKTIL